MENRIVIDSWVIDADVDSDGHLNIYITHDDNTQILDTERDPDNSSMSSNEYALRFTTEGIEEAYQESLS